MEQEIYKQELPIGKIISLGYSQYKENFKLIFMLVLAVSIGEYAVMLAVTNFLSGKFMEWFGAEYGPKYIAQFADILAGLIGMISTLAIIYVIKMRVDGQKIGFGQAWAKALSKWSTAFGTGVMQSIFLAGLTLLLIVPGVIFGVYWLFTDYAIVLYDKSGKSALDYSKAVAQGRWWKVFGASLAIGLISTFFANIPIAIAGIFLQGQDIFLFHVISFSSRLLSELMFAFYTVAFSVLFINFDATKKSNVPMVPSESVVPANSPEILP